MTSISVDETQLKELLKAAIVEVLQERRDLVRDAVEDALEDIGLARAIEEGEQSAAVDRADVGAMLRGDV